MTNNFSQEIVDFLQEKFPGKDIYNMSLEELEAFKKDVIETRQEYFMLEMAQKTLGNSGYGAAANRFFYFYNISLAGDITGECRLLTKTMNERLENWFHEEIWERKDLWKKFDFALDESKHDWYRTRHVWIYSDTDSTTYNSLIMCKKDGKIEKKQIGELFHDSYTDEKYAFNLDPNSTQEFCMSNYEVLNWTKEKGIHFVPIKYIMKHKVSKAKIKIKTKSGKEIIVTGDHSCIVFRDGKQLTVKACEINKDTDKILSIIYNDINEQEFEYQFEEIESIEQLEDFDNEEVFDIEVDDDSHTFIANDILVHNSSYVTYGDFFKCFTPEYQQKYDTDKKKVEWILKYNKEFHNDLNTKWCEELYEPRHGQNVHEFELETISYSGIYLKKKKYLKGLAFNKGKFFDEPKISGTGIEIIKSTTPKLCRKILTELMRSLMIEYDNSSEESKEAYIMYFNDKLAEYRKEFYNAPVEDISQSVGIGDYKKFVISDGDQLILEKGCPVSVQSIARFNHLAHKNGEDNKKQYSGKIKQYNIQIGTKGRSQTGYFGFPAGELPTWAPPMDKMVQWEKTIINPINSFLEVMELPLVSASNAVQMSLF